MGACEALSLDIESHPRRTSAAVRPATPSGGVSHRDGGAPASRRPKARSFDDEVAPEANSLDDEVAPEANSLDDEVAPEANSLDDEVAPEANSLDDEVEVAKLARA
ncbi:MAG: hypothetical protein ABSC94_13670 [Polyangiaceae bacterium]|jgi:hypothetical protein